MSPRNEQMTGQKILVATWAGVTDGTTDEQVIGQPTAWDIDQPHFRVFNSTNEAGPPVDLNGVDLKAFRCEPSQGLVEHGITLDQCMRARFFGFHSGVSSGNKVTARIEMQRQDDDTSRVSVNLGPFTHSGDSPTSNYTIIEPFFPRDFARKTVGAAVTDFVRYLFHVTPGDANVFNIGVALECYQSHGNYARTDGGRGFAVGANVRL